MSKDLLVVVGAGGMGEVIARRQGPGKKVLLADFNEQNLDLVAAGMKSDGHDVEVATVDVSEQGSVEALAAYAADLGPVRYVVHTAGISPTTGSVEKVLAVNALGVAYSLDAFGAVVAEDGAGVVISSMAGSLTVGRVPFDAEAPLRTVPSAELLQTKILDPSVIPDSGIAYSFAKRANQLRVEAASVEWGKRGARVNSISPGVISTEHGQRELNSEESGGSMRQMIAASGTKRIGTPQDIADAVAFLLGPTATFITGTDLLVDGGVVAAMRSGVLKAAR